MKSIARSFALLPLIVTLCVTAGWAQTIDLWINDGAVVINDRVMAENDLPDDLNIDGVQFKIGIHGQSSIVVEIDDRFYTVTDSTIEPVVDPRNVHVRIRSRNSVDDDSWTYEISGMDLRAVSQIGHVNIDEWLEAAMNITLTPQRVSVALADMADTEAYGKLRESVQVRNQVAARDGLSAQYGAALNRMAALLGYFSKIKAADEALYAEVQTEWEMESETALLAARIQGMQQGDERTEMVETLREQLEEIFDIKQDNRRREIEQMKKELERLEQRMMERNSARERLIDARLKDLLR